jgi:AmmeMemoRadiSam system protein B
MDANADNNEHSLEMHLPYIAKIMNTKTNGSYQLVPILVGNPSKVKEEQLANALIPFVNDPASLFIISSDFCHWGERFNFTPFKSEPQIYQKIMKLDLMGVDAIQSLSHEQFFEYIKQTGNTICGRNPISLALKMVDIVGTSHFKSQLLAYNQSSNVTMPDESSVSYVSMSISFC